jgi:cation diffusion facilitator family transporter
MFVIGATAGLLADSSGLIADALDMLADAAAYGIALAAASRAQNFKARAAKTSGIILLLLGAAAIVDAGRRMIWGSVPEGNVMMIVATCSLVVNSVVFYLLGRQRNKEVHLKVAYIFTRADVVANLGVIVSGILITTTGLRHADLVVGALIGLYIIRESLEILEEARAAKG